MPPSVRETIAAAVATVAEVRGWDGSLDGSVHINSYTGAHVFQNTDAAEEQALEEICSRILTLSGVHQARVTRELEAFELDRSMDTLVTLAEAIVAAGGTLAGF